MNLTRAGRRERARSALQRSGVVQERKAAYTDAVVGDDDDGILFEIGAEVLEVLENDPCLIDCVGCVPAAERVGVGEAPGVWPGRWSPVLGVAGLVEADVFRALIDGNDPTTSAAPNRRSERMLGVVSAGCQGQDVVLMKYVTGCRSCSTKHCPITTDVGRLSMRPRE